MVGLLPLEESILVRVQVRQQIERSEYAAGSERAVLSRCLGEKSRSGVPVQQNGSRGSARGRSFATVNERVEGSPSPPVEIN